MAVRIETYRTLLGRLGNLLGAPPRTNVDPVVDSLRRLAGGFDRLAARWSVVAVPQGLGLRHRGMGRAFRFLATGIRIHAAALFTRHPDELVASGPRVKAHFRTAVYLQKRWTRALHGALVLAHLRVPHWLEQMVKSIP